MIEVRVSVGCCSRRAFCLLWDGSLLAPSVTNCFAWLAKLAGFRVIFAVAWLGLPLSFDAVVTQFETSLRVILVVYVPLGALM